MAIIAIILCILICFQSCQKEPTSPPASEFTTVATTHTSNKQEEKEEETAEAGPIDTIQEEVSMPYIQRPQTPSFYLPVDVIIEEEEEEIIEVLPAETEISEEEEIPEETPIEEEEEPEEIPEIELPQTPSYTRPITPVVDKKAEALANLEAAQLAYDNLKAEAANSVPNHDLSLDAIEVIKSLIQSGSIMSQDDIEENYFNSDRVLVSNDEDPTSVVHNILMYLDFVLEEEVEHFFTIVSSEEGTIEEGTKSCIIYYETLEADKVISHDLKNNTWAYGDPYGDLVYYDTLAEAAIMHVFERMEGYEEVSSNLASAQDYYLSFDI
jgi:hypothetical protein